MSNATIRVTLVNHAAIDIARPAAVVWRDIVENIGEGNAFAGVGYKIEPLVDDPRALFGGYRMRFEKDGQVDERICWVTEKDEKAMRLGIHADYLSPGANGMVVYATYHAVPTEPGCRYHLDCHSTLDHQIAEGASREEVAASVAALRDLFNQGLATSFAGMKAKLEAQ